MSWLSVNRNPSRRQLFVFALSWLLMFTVAGWLIRGLSSMLWLAAVLWAAGLALPLASVVCPRVLRFFYLVMAFLAWPVAAAVSLILLGMVYFAVIAPIGVVLRWCGHDSMRRRGNPHSSGYWTARSGRSDVKRYFRQY